MSEPGTQPILCASQCKYCGTMSIGNLCSGELFQCPGCGIFFTARMKDYDALSIFLVPRGGSR